MARKNKLYELTPEHRAQLPAWRDRWIANAMSTAAMSDADRSACFDAVHGMYAAAKLPPPKAVVFVPSPFVLAFAGGFAAAIWQRHYATDAAAWAATWGVTSADTLATTWAATGAATDAATDAATSSATWDATCVATEAATRIATNVATSAATCVATEAATNAATRVATRVATWAATRIATGAATDAATSSATSSATDAATRAATRAAICVATEAATNAATDAATGAATWAATDAATNAATRIATWAATDAATNAATDAATSVAEANWFYVPCDMAKIATAIGVGNVGLKCAANVWRMWQGGNQWSGYDSYLTFFSDIAGLDLPEYAAYRHWRTLSEHSGPRIMHPDFCMISDRPEVLLVDEANRPHCDTGPFCRWRDGTALYSIHGVRIPAWLVEQPERLIPQIIAKETNSEIQRVMIERYGWDRYIAEVGGDVIDHDERYGTLLRTVGGLVLKVTNRSPEPDGTFRQYVLPVADQCEPLPDDGQELGEPQRLTALNAVASTFGMRGVDYAELVGDES